MGFETDKINNRRGKRIRWNSEYPLGSLGRDDYKNGESFYFMLGTWLEETEQLTDDDSAELVMRLEKKTLKGMITKARTMLLNNLGHKNLFFKIIIIKFTL